MNSISLAYGYGWRNSGDLAINQGSINLLNSLFPSLTPRVISMFSESSGDFSRTERKLEDPGYNYELVGGPIRYDPKTQPFIESLASLVGDGTRYVLDRSNMHVLHRALSTRMAAIIRDSDFLLYNGGNLIHHERSLPYLLGVLYPLQLARQYGVPYGILPHTVFDLDGRYDRMILALLDSSEFVWTRDERSYDYLTTEFDLSCPVLNGIDTAFFLSQLGQRCAVETTSDSRPSAVTFVPRFSTLGDTGRVKTDETENEVKDYLRVLNENGFEVDVTVQTKVEEEWVDSNRAFLEKNDISVFKSFNPGALRSHYAGRDLVVSMRLHAGIFAFSVGTPSIGLYRPEWGHKTPGTWENLGMEDYVLTCDEMTVDSLISLTEAALDEHKSLSSEIITNIEDKKEYMLRETESMLNMTSP